MRGGYIYNSTVKKKSFRKSRLSNISKNKTSKKNITAGRKNKYRKMRKNHKKTHAKKNKKHRKKLSRRKQRGGQALGNSPFSDSYTNTIPSRLPAGVYLINFKAIQQILVIHLYQVLTRFPNVLVTEYKTCNGISLLSYLYYHIFIVLFHQ